MRDHLLGEAREGHRLQHDLPGKIVLQTMPFSRLAEQVIAHAPALQRQGTSRGLIGGILGDQG